MSTENKKLFVGGLPDDVTEELMKKKFKIYGNITSVDIHRKKSLTDNTTNVFAFVTLNISQQNLNKCIYSNNDTTWKGKILKISVARENFLDRLVTERKENKIVKEWSQNPHFDNKNNYNKMSVVIDDKNKNKVLKYADDDDDDDIEDETELQPVKKQTVASLKKTKKDSNDDSDDGDSDDDDSDDEEVTRRIKENNNKSEIVKVKAEKASKKRKASSDDDDDDDNDIKQKKLKLETEEDMMAEKKKNLEILSSIVGKKPEKRKLPSSLNLQSTMMKRYDPSKPGHEEFEVEGQSEEEEDNSCEPMSKIAKKEEDDDDSSSSSDNDDGDDDNVYANKEITNKTSPTKNLPIDSKAFSEVSSSVVDAFKKTEAFKLSSLFGNDEDDEDEHGGDDDAAGQPAAKRPKLMSDMFGWDKEESDVVDDDDDDVDRSDDEGKKAQKKKSKDDATVSKKQKTKNKKSDVPSKFFFEINDPRLTEGNTFFRQDDIEELRKKWEDLRPQHVDSYRLRKKRYRMGKSKM